MQRMDSTSSDELLWVNVKKPTDIKNAGVMKQIRSHTQREVRRKERISKPKCTSMTRRCSKETGRLPGRLPGLPIKELPIVGGKTVRLVDRRPTDTVERRTILQNNLQDLAAETVLYPSPRLAIAISPKDPVRLNQRIYRYISLWQGDRALQLCGGDIHGRWEGWMPGVLTNETMMYAQAFCAATHFEFWGRHATTTETCALKDQAVVRVNKNLASPGFSQSDTNVASVLCLAFASHVENSGKDNCMTHMYGLQKIIAMRGGWKNVLSNELLSDLLAMADFLSAIIFKTNLTYTPMDVRQMEVPVYDPLNSPLISPSFFFNQPEQGEELSIEAFRTLSNMQKLTKSFEELHNSAGLPAFGSARMEACFKILQPASSSSPLAQSFSSSSSSPIAPSPLTSTTATTSSSSEKYSIASSPGKQTSDHIRDNLNEAVRLAGWIYFRALIRNIHFSHEANLSDALQLASCIEATALTGWTDLPGALLWVLLVATAALRSHPEGFIVSGHLSTSTLCIGVRHWLPVRRMLEKFMLIEAIVERNAHNAAASGSSTGFSASSRSGSSSSSEMRSKNNDERNVFDESFLQGESSGGMFEHMARLPRHSGERKRFF